ncbi:MULTISPECIES: sulfotransferase domain-containing protein [Methylomonas]|uniref:sulfotransferase domain-containing protein n=1 Tax=Methylomonas TaxID=416 RepID=UPI0012329705|nr:sulfotransferase domain-containing protein [Methylomonas rhizoryzae]
MDHYLYYKRKQLSRSYLLATEYTSIIKGYVPEDKLPSNIEYLSKWIEYQFLPHYFGYVPVWRSFVRKFSGKRTLPDFCVVGPIKSGTSDLAVNIMLHPNVIPPLVKECFSADLEKWRMYYPTERQKRKLASKYGIALTPFLAPYLHWMELIYNLSKERPETKVVLTLRDPVKRFYSQWKWEVYMAGKKRSDNLYFLNSFPAYVDKALSVFPDYPMFTTCACDPVQTSIYYKAVSYWIECFGKNNVLVLDAQDYFSDSNNFLNKIYGFVGLPNFATPQFKDRVNENPVVLPPADDESVGRLYEFFEPYNKKLWNILDNEFDWDVKAQ